MKAQAKPTILALAAALALAGCGKHPPASHGGAYEALPPVKVTLAETKAATIPLLEVVVGTVRPRKSAAVSAKITGRILTTAAVPGKRVARNDALVSLEVGEIQAARDGAAAAFENAERDLERYKGLLASNAVTQAEFDKVRAGQRIASASLKEAETMLGHATVRAPFDGVITRKLAEAGDLALPGKPLFDIENPAELRLEINVAESLAGALELGQKFRVTVEGAGLDLDGAVSEIAPSAHAGSRTFLVKLDLPQEKGLRAGQFGRAYLPRGEKKAILVPRAAVVQRGQMELVFVAEGSSARLRIVRTGRPMDGDVEILSGLKAGESVVVDPPAALRDGEPLETGAGS